MSDILDELGLPPDPAGTLLGRERIELDFSREAVERRKAEKRAQQAEQRRERASREPSDDWISKAVAWAPPTDLATRQTEVAWAVRGLIQRGKVGALVAAGGTGKTTLLLYLGICGALCRDFFGHGTGRGGTFVLLSSDDSQEDLDAALAVVVKALHLTPGEIELVARHVRVISLQGTTGTKTFTYAHAGQASATDMADAILQAVAGIPDLWGIALDTLRQFSGGSSNDEQVIKLTIAGATEVALRTAAFVILPHHTGKQNYREGVTDMYAGSGSAAIADNCRFVLLLQTTTWADIAAKVRRTGREQGDPLVLTSTRGSLLVKAADPIYLYRDGFYIGRVAGVVLSNAAQADERDRQILRAVRDGAQSKRAILAVVKGRRTAVFDRVDDLEDRGHLVRQQLPGSRSGSLAYVLTNSGVRFIADPPESGSRNAVPP